MFRAPRRFLYTHVSRSTASWSPNPLNVVGLFSSTTAGLHAPSAASASPSPTFTHLAFRSPSFLSRTQHLSTSSKKSSMAAAFAEFPYEPFNFDNNDFFEQGFAREQLTLRAAEKLWRNPVWISEATVRELELTPMPMEVPTPLWMPLCGSTFYPLRALPLNVQQLVLKKFRLPLNNRHHQQNRQHLVLTHNFAHYSWNNNRSSSSLIKHVQGGGGGGGDGGGDLAETYGATANVSSRSLAWHVAPMVHEPLFTAAWRDFMNYHLLQKEPREEALNQLRGASSRVRHAQIAAQSQLDRVWISKDARGAIQRDPGVKPNLPVGGTGGMVVTPSHVGMFYNAAQLFSNKLLVEKSNEALERMLLLQRQRELSYNTSSSSSDTALEGGPVPPQWPPIERTYDIGDTTMELELDNAASENELATNLHEGVAVAITAGNAADSLSGNKAPFLLEMTDDYVSSSIMEEEEGLDMFGDFPEGGRANAAVTASLTSAYVEGNETDAAVHAIEFLSNSDSPNSFTDVMSELSLFQPEGEARDSAEAVCDDLSIDLAVGGDEFLSTPQFQFEQHHNEVDDDGDVQCTPKQQSAAVQTRRVPSNSPTNKKSVMSKSMPRSCPFEPQDAV